MKYVFYFAIVILVSSRIHAQQADPATTGPSKVTHISCSGGAFAATDSRTHQLTTGDLLAGYAATVDGLLRNVADQMRIISANVESGDLNPMEALALKLETARAMIARLETISAVYDAVILSGADGDDDEPTPGNSSPATAASVALRRGRTISVGELLRQAQ